MTATVPEPRTQPYPAVRAHASAAVKAVDTACGPFLAALRTAACAQPGWCDTGADRARDALAAAQNALSHALFEAGRTLAARDITL